MGCPDTYAAGTYGSAGTIAGGHYPVLVFEAPAAGPILSLSDPCAVLTDLRGTGIPEVRRQLRRPPLRDGEAVVRRRFEPRFVEAAVVFAPGGWSVLQATRLAAAAAANPKVGQGDLVYRPDAGAPEYRIAAELEDGLRFGDLQGALERARISFRCADPAWRVAPERVEVLASVAGGIGVPLETPVDVAAGGASVTLVNGDPATEPAVESYPLIEFEAGARGCAGPEIRNDTTGQRWAFRSDLELAPGEVLTLDMDRQTAVRGDGTTVIGYRTDDSVGWAIQPGSNVIASDQASREMTVRVRWWPRLIGV